MASENQVEIEDKEKEVNLEEYNHKGVFPEEKPEESAEGKLEEECLSESEEKNKDNQDIENKEGTNQE